MIMMAPPSILSSMFMKTAKTATLWVLLATFFLVKIWAQRSDLLSCNFKMENRTGDARANSVMGRQGIPGT